jgi:hypothetical protein
MLLAACVLAPAAEAATVAPHRALYNLTLLRASEGASLQSASGKLAFEVQGSSCEGYTVNFRMATKYGAKEGDPTVIDTRTTTYEGPGSLELRHQLLETINGDTKQDLKITVDREAADKPGSGSISTKPTEPFTVPAGAALPMQHQLKLMTLGEHGGGRDSSIIYDGSDEAKAFRAISFVGAEKPAGTIARDAANPAAAPLKPVGAWPMTISYYPVEGNDEIPQYQVSFDMYENGVASNLTLDYGDFALTGTLEKLELLEPSSCP